MLCLNNCDQTINVDVLKISELESKHEVLVANTHYYRRSLEVKIDKKNIVLF